MYECGKEQTTENTASCTKRKLSTDGSFLESESQQVDKKIKFCSENKKAAENESKSESEQVISNEVSNLSVEKDDAVTSGNAAENELMSESERVISDEKNNLSEKKDDAGTSSNIRPPRPRFEPECKLCHKRFYSATTYFLHIESKSHKKRAKPKELFECKLCEKTFEGTAMYDIHVGSKKHQKNLYNHHLSEKFNVDKSTLPTKAEASAKRGPIFSFFCKICSKKFSGLISYDLHMSSPTHNKMVEKATLEKIASCAICNLSFLGLTSYEIHMSSALHMKNVQQARSSSYGTNFSMSNN